MKNVIHVFGVSGSGTTMARLCLSAFARVATCYHCRNRHTVSSLPQRIRAGCDHPSQCNRHGNVFLCHSAFVRVATLSARPTLSWASLPQRIRAGCDSNVSSFSPYSGLCHSAFVRVATCFTFEGRDYTLLCHSAFVRVATTRILRFCCNKLFATAHSCGLRRKDCLRW